MTTPPPKPSTTTLRVLHTSDWHLGKRLHQQQRYEEFVEFLDWLVDCINTQAVDVLIVAGDVFDTMTPSNKAQELYYRFLGMVAKSSCRHIIITAGNHDSPTFLDAPKSILTFLNIHVIGMASSQVDDELLILNNDGIPEAIILAVPYLRDKDVRDSGIFDDIKNKEYDTISGIANHYKKLATHAKEQQARILTKHHKKVPIIATGHLFIAGSHTSSHDDGMRELYVGTLGQVSASIFDEAIDYVALGHIHAPQKVAGCEHIRYCGSPIAMGFGEVGKSKQVLIIDFTDEQPPKIHTLPIPVFQRLARITGDWDDIINELTQLYDEPNSIWVEVIYTGSALRPTLTQDIRELLKDTNILALSIQNQALYKKTLAVQPTALNIKSLSEMDIFTQLLDKKGIDEGEQTQLKTAYQILLSAVHDSDQHAE